MKRRVLLLLAVVFAASASYAAPITSRQAAKNVSKFLYGDSGLKFSRGAVAMASAEEGIQPYYIFNVGENDGFVIASGDDAAYPVLGYSYSGHIDMENIPDNMRAMLEDYARDIMRIQKLNLPARVQTRAEGAKPAIPALLTTQWAQVFPFNKFTPDFNDSYGHRPTGCVATAIAQIMNYHQWPEGKTGSVASYTYKDEYTGGDGKEKTVEALEPTVFDWDAMLDVYDDMSNVRSADAVSNLMNYVGRSVKMVYGPYSSGAFATDMIPALVGVFGYKNTAKLEYKEYFSEQSWNDKVYNELANNRPVLYFGVTEGNQGHQFVCDGYENEYFHINWGWAGVSDGFYKLSALAPEEQGTGGAGSGDNFSNYQNAVFGLEKPVTADRLYVRGTMANKNNPFDINVKFDNASGKFVAADFDITFPEGISVVEGEIAFDQLRSENGDHKISIKKLDGNMYHVSIASASKSKIIVSSGSLFRIVLKCAAEAGTENLTGSISNIVMRDAADAETKLEGSTFAMNFYKTAELIMGDANKDGKVTMDDVTVIDDYIMYKFPKPFSFDLADMNKDGLMDAADLMAVLDVVLKNSGAERHFAETVIDKNDAITFSAVSGGFDMNLANTTVYKAIQADVIVPSGIKITDIVPNAERAAGFVVSYTMISEGRYRMIMYSPVSNNIQPGSKPVLRLVTDKEADGVKLVSIVMVTSDLKRTTFADVDSKTPTGIDSVVSDNGEKQVYTIEGIRVDAALGSLPKGVYIVNGKKVVVR